VNVYEPSEDMRAALSTAREESARFHHPYCGTEHLVLGFVRRGEGTARDVLRALEIDTERVRATIEGIIKPSEPSARGSREVPFTTRAQQALAFAVKESLELGHADVGSGHLLLGVVREKVGVGGQALMQAGVTEAAARAALVRLVAERG
jgi:ATP-dependent Clp protease ATP-binding subunit ClpC